MVEHIQTFGEDAAGEGISEGQTAGRRNEADGLRAAEGNAFSEDLNRVIAGLHHLLNNHKNINSIYHLLSQYDHQYDHYPYHYLLENRFKTYKIIIELNEFEKG
jgi:hypothetical protein